jgi:hypothetical protein
MLKYHDCLDLLNLSEGEILKITEHEHLTEIVEQEYDGYFVQTPEGEPALHRRIAHEMKDAEARGDHDLLHRLRAIVARFIHHHPDHKPGGAA